MARVYLDWAASAPPQHEIAEKAIDIAREHFGNPSSPHAEGRAAESVLSAARERFATAAGTDTRSIVFTSGGTESNNIVLTSLISNLRGGEIVVSGIEHSSVYEPASNLERLGFRVHWVQAESSGAVDPQRLADCLSAETVMVAVMHVNNETGAVQPLGEISRRIREFERSRRGGKRIHLHCDGVQALGKVEVNYRSLDVDSASFSGHKLGGLRGAGALYLRRPIDALFRGGGQEANLRPGTENLPAIWSLAEAAVRSVTNLDRHFDHALRLRTLLLEGIRAIEGAVFVPPAAADAFGKNAVPEGSFSPYILSVAFPPLPGEVLVRVLNDAGFAVSTGSACSSKRERERRVLLNMGTGNELARSAIRISTGYSTEEEDVLRFIEVLHREVLKWNTPLRA